MRWYLKVIITVAVLVALQLVTLQAQEPVTRLRWKNGDVLPGKLLESKAGQVRWTSPYFSDNLVIDVGALDSILFSKRSTPPTETFRVSMVSGDVWIADLIGADNNTFLFSSERHGQVRVSRNAIYTLNQQQNPNLVFNGSSLPNWNLPQEGGIKDMTYKVYKMGKKRGEAEFQRFPDFSKLTPQAEGSFETGWLDLKLAEMEDSFGMVFEGRLEMDETGEYIFELASDDGSRLLIDGQPAVKARTGVPEEAKIKLAAGSHTLRVEYFEAVGTELLRAWWTGPNLVRTPLFSNGMFGAREKESFTIDDVKLDRALTIPRFNRDNPPSHVLVAKTGDLMRGSLLDISGQRIQFESKLRKMNIPVNRVAMVVNVSMPEEDLDKPRDSHTTNDNVRATLTDGSTLVFEALESNNGKLLGHSPFYGEMAIPITSIQHLTFGEFEKEKLKSVFDEWVVQQGREPEYSKQPPP